MCCFSWHSRARTYDPQSSALPTELYANMFGGRSWIRTNNVYLSEQIYSLPQHHRRCRPSVYGAESQNRTDNLSLTRRLLYLLSYFSIFYIVLFNIFIHFIIYNQTDFIKFWACCNIISNIYTNICS